jgi:hypothetical protein
MQELTTDHRYSLHEARLALNVPLRRLGRLAPMAQVPQVCVSLCSGLKSTSFMRSRSLSSGAFNSPSFCKSGAQFTLPCVETKHKRSYLLRDLAYLAASPLPRNHWAYCKYPDLPLHKLVRGLSCSPLFSIRLDSPGCFPGNTIAPSSRTSPKDSHINGSCSTHESKALSIFIYLLRIVWNTNSI